MGYSTRRKNTLTRALLEWNDALSEGVATESGRDGELALLWTTRVLALKMLCQRGLEPTGTIREMVALLREADAEHSAFEILTPILDRLRRSFPGTPLATEPSLDTLHVDPTILATVLEISCLTEEQAQDQPWPLDEVGRAYERFLGALGEATGGRKTRGVYYTPRPIVDHMLDHTLSPLLKGCSDLDTVSALRILDPACGNGIFLMGAFDLLAAWYREYFRSQALELKADGRYSELTRPEHRQWAKVTEDANNGRLNVELSVALRRRILTTNLRGVDVDSRSAHLARLCVGLHGMSGLPQKTLLNSVDLFQRAILPDLRGSILTGNSLIDTDVAELIKQTSLLDTPIDAKTIDWASSFPCIAEGGFDVVIGNPPYDVLEKERGSPRSPHALAAAYLRSHPDYEPARGGKLNLFRCFLLRGIRLTRDGGQFSMIVPMAIMGDSSCTGTREFLFSRLESAVADCFPNKDRVQQRVFAEAKLSTAIVSGRRTAESSEERPITIRMYEGGQPHEPIFSNEVTLSDAELMNPRTRPIPIVDEMAWQLCKRIYERSDVVALGSVAGLRVNRGEINQTLYRQWIRETPQEHPLIRGADVAPFGRRPQPSQGQRKWLDSGAWSRKTQPRETVNLRRIAIQRITGMDEARRLIASLIDAPAFFADSTNSMVVDPDGRHAPEYVVGLLNSSLLQWRFKMTSSNNNVSVAELSALPFRVIDRRVGADQALHDRIVQCVRALMHRRAGVAELPSGTQVLRADLLEDLDWAVGELYGLDRSEMERIASPWGRHAN